MEAESQIRRPASREVLFLFGPPGSGKNFVGELLAAHFGFSFFDADLWLPKELRATLAQGRAFSTGLYMFRIPPVHTQDDCSSPDGVCRATGSLLRPGGFSDPRAGESAATRQKDCGCTGLFGFIFFEYDTPPSRHACSTCQQG